MRQVKAKSAPAKRTPQGGGRGAKHAARTPEKRAEPRGRKPARETDGEGEAQRFGWLRSTFPFRQPMLTLTLAVVVAGGALGLIAGGYVSGAVSGVENKVSSALKATGFAVTSIAIAGNERTTPAQVRRALQMHEGDSIFAARPDAARARLMQLPWVSDAEIRRTFPGSIAVRLIEKRPFALWAEGKRFQVVERSGAIITETERSAFAHLPVLFGKGAPEAAAPLIDALTPDRAIKARLVAIERIAERRWDLALAGGVTVRLPEVGWEKELAELERLIVEKGVLERDIEIIDLRYPDNYVFRLHNGDSRPVPRERRA
jgi:cell division protein FtsQ